MLIFRDIYHFILRRLIIVRFSYLVVLHSVSQLTHKTLISWLELFVLLRRSNI